MKQNMGKVDRGIRAVVAVVIAVLYFTGTVSGTIAIILAVIGVGMVISSASGSCFGYLPLGIDTRKEAKQAAPDN